MLRFGVPRKGRWEEQGLSFLESCGLRVRRVSERQLTASMSGLRGVTVVLQRAEDVLTQVMDGTVDVGMTGLDMVHERRGEGDELVVLHDALGFSSGDVVVAVPESWLDVTTMADLADVAIELRERGDELRVATSFPNLTKRFFYRHGISHFSFVHLAGGVEAAPRIGLANVVVDVTSTGTTLKENHLKVLRNGVVMHFQACLIGNRRALTDSPDKRELTRRILELVEAKMRAQEFFSITANLRAASEREVAAALVRSPATRGRRGPTIARVYSHAPEGADGVEDTDGAGDRPWFAATVIAGSTDLQEAIDHLRSVGGSGISVVPLRYLFDARSDRFNALLRDLGVSETATHPDEPPAAPRAHAAKRNGRHGSARGASNE